MIASNLSNTSETQKEIRKAFETPEKKALIAAIEERRKKAWLYAGIGSAAIFLIVLLVAGLLVEDGLGWLLGSVVGVILGGSVLAVSLGSFRANTARQVNAHILPELVRIVLGQDVVYEPDAGFSRSFLDTIGAFPVNILNQSERLHGTYEGVPFMCADVKSFHYETHSNGRSTYTTVVTDFLGTVFIFRFNKPSKAILRIVEKGFPGSLLMSGKSTKIETESIDFNSRFKTYANDEHQALYVMTPQNIMAFLDAQSLVKGKELYIIDNDKLIVVCSGGTVSLDASFSGRFDDRDIMKMADQLVPLKGFVKTLRLDNTYWDDIAKLQSFTAESLLKKYGGPGKNGNRNMFTGRNGRLGGLIGNSWDSDD